MSWFRNNNTQAQVNAAISAGLTQVENKQAEIDRVRDEAAYEAARTARKADDKIAAANRASRRKASDLEDKIFDQSVELAKAQNIINQLLIGNEALKRLGTIYCQQAGISFLQFEADLATKMLDVKEELALQDVPVPKPPEKIIGVKTDYSDPKNTFLEAEGYTWLPEHEEWISNKLVARYKLLKPTPR